MFCIFLIHVLLIYLYLISIPFIFSVFKETGIFFVCVYVAGSRFVGVSFILQIQADIKSCLFGKSPDYVQSCNADHVLMLFD